MHGRHYHAESARLREIAAEFAVANPALAPLLNGPMTDPDVERLLDAVAFQNDLLAGKLESDFPELVRSLAQLVLPHYLRPIPASAIVVFSPKLPPEQPVTIPAGARLASLPVDGTSCRFMTTRDLPVHPLEITEAALINEPGRSPEIRLSFALRGLSLSRWRPGKIHVFLSGERANATDLYQLLSGRLARIVVSAPGAGTLVLPPACLKPAGFGEEDALFPSPPNAFPGYRILREYFTAPEQFLFFELSGLERWTNRGESGEFTVSFLLDGLTSRTPRVARDQFVLNAVPAVNLYRHDAVPIRLDHRASRYPVRPSGPDPSHHRIFSIDRVTGISRDTGIERNYAAFELFSPESALSPRYQASMEKSNANDGYDTCISVSFPEPGGFTRGETLSVELTCTNGRLPESLRIGDIHIPESGIPENVTCRNITNVNPGAPPPFGPGLLWRLTTHLYLNHVPLENAAHLRALLKLYLFAEDSSGASLTADLKRIDGIEEVAITADTAMMEGVPVRGSHIRLRVREDHFAGAGDLYLFGCVLHRFLEEYAAINCFARLTIDEPVRGERYQWPSPAA